MLTVKKKKKSLGFNLPDTDSKGSSLMQGLQVWNLVWENEAALERRSDSRVLVLVLPGITEPVSWVGPVVVTFQSQHVPPL